jgi:hypothetical protein
VAILRNLDDFDNDMLESITRALNDDGDSVPSKIDDAENDEEGETGKRNQS